MLQRIKDWAAWITDKLTVKTGIIIVQTVLIAVLAVFLVCVSASKSQLVQKKEVVTALPGEKMYINDGMYGDIWLPVLEDVPLSTYDASRIKEENGLKYYEEDGQRISCAGVDVSSYQGSIDWERVKASGIDFAMIRLGFRGYGESGNLVVDSEFENNISGAKKAGLDVGVYFFSQAVTEKEAIEEAQFVIEQLKGHKITYPVAYDFEIIHEDGSRTAQASAEMMTKVCIAFCNAVQEAGYTPMFYTNRRTALLKYDMTQLCGYDFWYVQYGDKPDFIYDFAMWQYSESGTIDGISGAVDLNLCFKPYK